MDPKLTQSLLAALKQDNSSELVQLLIASVDTLPISYQEKRVHGKNTVDIVKNLATKITNMLEHSFLQVDFSECAPRSVQKADWNNIVAVRRSEEGSSGIYFIQSEHPSQGTAGPNSPHHPKDIIVAKGVTEADFERQQFIHDLATGYFDIKCPEIRFVNKKSEEFEHLRTNVKKLFSPLFDEMYENGGQSSPKPLFDGPGIMLMQMVNGKPLCHRLNGQRLITGDDYQAIGRLFLFDLLIHNSDRLPCRKAFPRGSIFRADQGNEGNIMFGANREVWAIDAEMPAITDENLKNKYVRVFDSVVFEITSREAFKPIYKSISKLFFKPIPGLFRPPIPFIAVTP
jgi:hypothetical protein